MSAYIYLVKVAEQSVQPTGLDERLLCGGKRRVFVGGIISAAVAFR